MVRFFVRLLNRLLGRDQLRDVDVVTQPVTGGQKVHIACPKCGIFSGDDRVRIKGSPGETVYHPLQVHYNCARCGADLVFVTKKIAPCT